MEVAHFSDGLFIGMSLLCLGCIKFYFVRRDGISRPGFYKVMELLIFLSLSGFDCVF